MNLFWLEFFNAIQSFSSMSSYPASIARSRSSAKIQRHSENELAALAEVALDEAGLCRALLDRPDLTAILDVNHPEPPLADSPLRTLPNVFLAPHIAGSMSREVARLGWCMLYEAERWIEGWPMRHCIDYQTFSLRA